MRVRDLKSIFELDDGGIDVVIEIGVVDGDWKGLMRELTVMLYTFEKNGDLDGSEFILP